MILKYQTYLHKLCLIQKVNLFCREEEIFSADSKVRCEILYPGIIRKVYPERYNFMPTCAEKIRTLEEEEMARKRWLKSTTHEYDMDREEEVNAWNMEY